MGTHQLPRNKRQSYFDSVSRAIVGQQVQIETAGLKLGDQINREWASFDGIAYDPKSDIIEVIADDLDHLIHHPKGVYVEDAGAMLRSIDVLDSDENHQIIRLREPIELPGP